ncbi:AAA family ATPase [Micromonospora sp. CPCC 205371]|nr:AAA family ATPase [Micromonospora sp. CPCC 205371]
MITTGIATLVVIRGNSGSGKTTTAREVRRDYGRGCALLEQDYLRRIMLREHDSRRTNPVAPAAFIATTTRTALDLGYHVALEAILHSDRYGAVLHQLIDAHTGPTHTSYLDVSFNETVRRHRGRADSIDFTPEQVREWYAYKGRRSPSCSSRRSSSARTSQGRAVDRADDRP